MKKIKTLLAAALLLAVASCSKSKNDFQGPSPTVNKKFMQSVYTGTDGSVETESATYDAQGRLASYISDDYSYLFSYESPKLLKITRKKQSDGIINQERTCTLNDDGAIIKMVYTSLPDDQVTYTYECGYDANGYLNKVKGYTPSGNGFEEIFEIVNGLAVTSRSYNDGILYHNREYIYDNSVVCNAAFTAWGLWPVETLFGKKFKHPLVEYKDHNTAGALTWHSKFSYLFDDAGYPLKLTTNYIHTGTKTEATYTFQ